MHAMRNRPPILDVPPLVSIGPPGAPNVCTPISDGPLWLAAPPCLAWREAVSRWIVVASLAALNLPMIAVAAVDASSQSAPLRASPEELRAPPRGIHITGCVEIWVGPPPWGASELLCPPDREENELAADQGATRGRAGSPAPRPR